MNGPQHEPVPTRVVRCPTCGGDERLLEPPTPTGRSAAQRCKNNDFGAWAAEGYRVEAPPAADPDAGEPDPHRAAARDNPQFQRAVARLPLRLSALSFGERSSRAFRRRRGSSMIETSGRPVTALAAARFGAPTQVLLVDDHALCRLGMKALFDGAGIDAIEWIEASTLQRSAAIACREPRHRAGPARPQPERLQGPAGAEPDPRTTSRGPRRDPQRHARRIRRAPGQGDGRGRLPAQGLGAGADARCAARARGPAPPARHRAAFPSHPSASRYDRVAELGPRHLDILELVLSGCTNQEISSSTQLSLGTVKNYVSTILLALDVKSRSHLISLFR